MRTLQAVKYWYQNCALFLYTVLGQGKGQDPVLFFYPHDLKNVSYLY